MPNARKVLVSLLLRAEKNGYSNLLLNAAFKENSLSALDKAFVTGAFYGVLERRLTIDYLLNQFLKKPVQKTAPYTAAVLRSGTYQILWMNKVPNSAAVNESVQLIRASKERGNSGLVNAVLHRLCELDLENALQDAEPFVRFSVNPWIAEQLIADYGLSKATAFLADTLCPPPVHIRLNPKAASPDKTLALLRANGVILTAEQPNGCYRAEGIKNIEQLQQQSDYGFFVQEFASQLCAAALMAKPGQRILDACAAPGGKAFCIALNAADQLKILACELHEQRVMLIKKGAERLKLSGIEAMQQDATVYNENLGQFDRILCDVPCSGLGVMRRKPELKYKTLADCAALPPLQLQILCNTARYLKPGGRLVYSTCTVLKEENQAIVSAFLKQNPQFHPAPLWPGECTCVAHTFLPPASVADGFYIAALER